MEIEAGKVYVIRDGGRLFFIKNLKPISGWFIGEEISPRKWFTYNFRNYGRFKSQAESFFDLIAEWTRPVSEFTPELGLALVTEALRPKVEKSEPVDPEYPIPCLVKWTEDKKYWGDQAEPMCGTVIYCQAEEIYFIGPKDHRFLWNAKEIIPNPTPEDIKREADKAEAAKEKSKATDIKEGISIPDKLKSLKIGEEMPIGANIYQACPGGWIVATRNWAIFVPYPLAA